MHTELLYVLLQVAEHNRLYTVYKRVHKIGKVYKLQLCTANNSDMVIRILLQI